MTDLTQATPPLRSLLRHVDPIWILAPLIPLAIWAFDPANAGIVWGKMSSAFLGTLPFILFAVAAIATLKATGAESLLAEAFKGRAVRMIILAALLGGLSPFCSCEVIPFIAALLAAGAPLAAVMAFWLSSPIMDPAMFLITSGELGLGFALMKTASAVGLGMMGGFTVYALSQTPLFADPLRARAAPKTCGCGPAPFSQKPVWAFWTEPKRREDFVSAARENILFLGKWLLLAYALEGLMVTYVPAEWIAGILGGDGILPIVLGASVGAPAYLNGYAAVPLISGLLEQGMVPGAGMSFAIAGGVTSIPAAIAVWALVKPRVFASYLVFAFAGAMIAGLIWNMIA